MPTRRILMEYKSPSHDDWFVFEGPTTWKVSDAIFEFAETLDQCPTITDFRVTVIDGDGRTADATQGALL